jgi:hypothetical protein
MQPEATTSLNLSFEALFERYSERTDGKLKIAASIAQLAGSEKDMHLLDLGAGDGRLTRLLAPQFASTTAVDKKPAFRAQLEAIPGVVAITSTIEDLRIDRPFDIGLLSYSLSGVPLEKLRETIDSLFAQSSREGRLFYITFEDGCEWDCYASEVYATLGIPRNGGSKLHKLDLAAVGIQTQEVDSFRTSIWDSSLDELYKTLAFFFVTHARDYIQRQNEFLSALSLLVQEVGAGRISLPVTEKVFEIIRPTD